MRFLVNDIHAEISPYCTNFNYMYYFHFSERCLRLIDIPSANQHTEMFACILIIMNVDENREEEILALA